ncbi:MAG: acetylglutamate kinase [Armatimonadota bacterium]|nr:acetylglutamate kinase [Armatimonadota bacterium]
MINNELQRRAQVLIEALPYIRHFYGKHIVIKYGGKAMTDEKLKRQVIADIVLLHYVGIKPVLVHGGGPEINDAMRRMGKQPQFVSGLRITDEETVRIVEMVLVGSVNKELVELFNQNGAKAIGLSGKDGNLFTAQRLTPDKTEGIDLGFVGEVESINTEVLSLLIANGYIPVIASIGSDKDGRTLNLNADHVAGKLAAAINAIKLIVLTDVRGVCRNPNDEQTLISTLTDEDALMLIREGIISGGMIPKVEACIEALKGGVERAHIINGAIPHALLMELFTDEGIGTMLIPSEQLKRG